MNKEENMNEQLEVKIKMRFRDALRYHLYVAYSTMVNRIFALLSLTSLGMFIYSMITGNATMDVRFAKSFALLIPPFIFFVMIPVKVWKATAALLDSQLLKEEAIYIFDVEKVTLKTSQGQAEIQWDEYIRIVETRHDIRFFMDKIQAQIIPKYGLTGQEKQILRGIIAQAAGPQITKIKPL